MTVESFFRHGAVHCRLTMDQELLRSTFQPTSNQLAECLIYRPTAAPYITATAITALCSERRRNSRASFHNMSPSIRIFMTKYRTKAKLYQTTCSARPGTFVTAAGGWY